MQYAYRLITVKLKIKVEVECLLEQTHGVQVNFRFNEMITDRHNHIFGKYPKFVILTSIST